MSSRLQEILEDQFAEAKAKAGQKVVRKLNKGLRIEMSYLNNKVTLVITRDEKYPSLQEWETVLNLFPYPVPTVEPVWEQQGSRYCIFARFALERMVQMKFMFGDDNG
jgi:hypothetical protein